MRNTVKAEHVRASFAEYLAANPPVTKTLKQWERLSDAGRAKFRQQGWIEHHTRVEKAIAYAASEHGVSTEKVRAIVDHVQIAEPWFLQPIDGAKIALRAALMFESHPDRESAAEWKLAKRHAELMRTAIADGDAEGAAWAAIFTMQKVIRAELLEGPMPMISQLRNRPRSYGQMAKGKPKPNRKTPIRQALEVLVDEGMTNDQILEALSDADGIATSARDWFPIEVLSPHTTVKDDGLLLYYPRGGNSEKPSTKKIADLRKLLSKIRTSRKAA
ncbi:MAG: hypothetical protein ACT4PZ_15050 [Panacagrimonas sp.]